MRTYPLAIMAVPELDCFYTMQYQSYGFHPIDMFCRVLYGDWSRVAAPFDVRYAWAWELPHPPGGFFTVVKLHPETTRGARPITYVYANDTMRV